MKSSPATEALLGQLDTQSDHRAAAITAKLARRPRAEVLAALKVLGRDPDRPRVQKWALYALGVLGDESARRLLTRALADERMTVRLQAMKGLGRLGGAKTVTALIPLLDDPSGGIRINAVTIMADILKTSKRPSPRARAALTVRLRDPKAYVRKAAATALKTIFGK